MVVDLYLVYSFIRRLVTPFKNWEAYKLGIIDEKGNVLISRKDFTKAEQRKAFGIFDQLILNIKKLLAKIPGGSTRLGTYAAALWLIKEQAAMEEKGMLNEDCDIDDNDIESKLQSFMEEYSELFEKANHVEEGPCWDTHKQVGMKKKGNKVVPNCVPKNEDAPTVNVGGGAVAGLGVGDQGEPGLTKAQQKKYKKKNFKDLVKSIK